MGSINKTVSSSARQTMADAMILTILVATMTFLPSCTTALDCYSCYSKNGSDRTCDDPVIRLYMEEKKPVECIFPTPLLNSGTPNESTDHPEINSGAELVQTEYENIKEIGPKYEVEKTKFTHIEKHHQTKVAESSDRYCVKVIGTTTESKENLVIRTCINKDMNSQCGIFTFKEDQIRGCMLTCQENKCNLA